MSDAHETDGGLRARRRAQTERDIEDAALDAFEAAGFDATTMEQIAHSAGVSVRTAFRYFPTKIDTVLVSARAVTDALEAGLHEDLASGVSLARLEDSIAGALESLVGTDVAAVARLKRLRSLMLVDARVRAEVARTEGYIAQLDAPGRGGGAVTLEARIVAGTAAATLRAAFDSWASIEGAGPELIDHYRRAREARDRLVAG